MATRPTLMFGTCKAPLATSWNLGIERLEESGCMNRASLRNAVLLLLCCSSGGTHVFPQSPVVEGIPQTDPQIFCRSLKGMRVPAAALGLPTTGAYVRSAKPVRDNRGEYCKVLGGVRPVDPTAHDIRFEVNLPTHWNRKAVQFGGGSFDGYLGATNGLERTPVSVASQPGPLARGFVTFGGDSGHHKHYLLLPDVLNVVNASFARNAEERRNFAQDGLKKTHDAAVAIMERDYGMRPTRMFFLGGSTGGREAYFVVQRWPEDYDGVLGAYAGWDQTELDLQFIRVSQAMYAKGGFLPRSKTRLLAKSVMNACDSLDGVRDGIIANVAACHFDPLTLLCPTEGKRKDCLTPQQLRTVQTHRQVRERDARELLLLGDLISAERAREMGLVNRVVTQEQLLDEALALARTALQGAPQAIAHTKKVLDELWPSSFNHELDETLLHHLSARASPEVREGVAAFLEKRNPSWYPKSAGK